MNDPNEALQVLAESIKTTWCPDFISHFSFPLTTRYVCAICQQTTMRIDASFEGLEDIMFFLRPSSDQKETSVSDLIDVRMSRAQPLRMTRKQARGNQFCQNCACVNIGMEDLEDGVDGPTRIFSDHVFNGPLSDIVLFQVERKSWYSKGKNGLKIDDTKVTFSHELKTNPKWFANTKDHSDETYLLQAVGVFYKNHYWCYSKNSVDQQWYKYDDLKGQSSHRPGVFTGRGVQRAEHDWETSVARKLCLLVYMRLPSTSILHRACGSPTSWESFCAKIRNPPAPDPDSGEEKASEVPESAQMVTRSQQRAGADAELPAMGPVPQLACELAYSNCQKYVCPPKYKVKSHKFHTYYWAMSQMLGWPHGLKGVCGSCLSRATGSKCDAPAGNRGFLVCAHIPNQAYVTAARMEMGLSNVVPGFFQEQERPRTWWLPVGSSVDTGSPLMRLSPVTISVASFCKYVDALLEVKPKLNHLSGEQSWFSPEGDSLQATDVSEVIDQVNQALESPGGLTPRYPCSRPTLLSAELPHDTAAAYIPATNCPAFGAACNVLEDKMTTQEAHPVSLLVRLINNCNPSVSAASGLLLDPSTGLLGEDALLGAERLGFRSRHGRRSPTEARIRGAKEPVSKKRKRPSKEPCDPATESRPCATESPQSCLVEEVRDLLSKFTATLPFAVVELKRIPIGQIFATDCYTHAARNVQSRTHPNDCICRHTVSVLVPSFNTLSVSKPYLDQNSNSSSWFAMTRTTHFGPLFSLMPKPFPVRVANIHLAVDFAQRLVASGFVPPTSMTRHTLKPMDVYNLPLILLWALADGEHKGIFGQAVYFELTKSFREMEKYKTTNPDASSLVDYTVVASACTKVKQGRRYNVGVVNSCFQCGRSMFLGYVLDGSNQKSCPTCALGEVPCTPSPLPVRDLTPSVADSFTLNGFSLIEMPSLSEVAFPKNPKNKKKMKLTVQFKQALLKSCSEAVVDLLKYWYDSKSPSSSSPFVKFLFQDIEGVVTAHLFPFLGLEDQSRLACSSKLCMRPADMFVCSDPRRSTKSQLSDGTPDVLRSAHEGLPTSPCIWVFVADGQISCSVRRGTHARFYESLVKQRSVGSRPLCSPGETVTITIPPHTALVFDDRLVITMPITGHWYEILVKIKPVWAHIFECAPVVVKSSRLTLPDVIKGRFPRIKGSRHFCLILHPLANLAHGTRNCPGPLVNC